MQCVILKKKHVAIVLPFHTKIINAVRHKHIGLSDIVHVSESINVA